MLTSVLAGLGLGFSLIVAIGAQNLFVLRQGLRRENVIVIAVICAVSDAALIILGVSGIGLVLQAVPWLIDVVRWAGAAFLLVYGLLAARRAWRPTGQALEVAETEGIAERGAAAVGGTANAGAAATGGGIAATGGGTAATGGGIATRGAAATGVGTATRTVATRARGGLVPAILTCLALTWLNPHVYLDTVFLLGTVANTHGADRWWFAAGAVTASILWFFGLAFGARFLGRWLSTPRAWRILDGVIAVVMIALAVSLVLPH